MKKENPLPEGKPEDAIDGWQDLSQDEVRKLTTPKATKSCEMDIMPTKILDFGTNHENDKLIPEARCLCPILETPCSLPLA